MLSHSTCTAYAEEEEEEEVNFDVKFDMDMAQLDDPDFKAGLYSR